MLIKIHIFSLNKIHLSRLSAKWWPFCLGFNVSKSHNWAGIVPMLITLTWNLPSSGLVAKLLPQNYTFLTPWFIQIYAKNAVPIKSIAIWFRSILTYQAIIIMVDIFRWFFLNNLFLEKMLFDSNFIEDCSWRYTFDSKSVLVHVWQYLKSNYKILDVVFLSLGECQCAVYCECIIKVNRYHHHSFCYFHLVWILVYT